MADDQFLRVAAVVQLAFVPATGEHDPPPVLDIPSSSAITERVRTAAQRLRLHHDSREVFGLLADGMATLERELHDLRMSIALQKRGIALHSQLITLGADGLTLQRRGPWAEGSRVHVFLALRIWQSERLIALTGLVRHLAQDDTELIFERPPPDQHDALIAFCFQQQGMERRRAHSNSHR